MRAILLQCCRNASGCLGHQPERLLLGLHGSLLPLHPRWVSKVAVYHSVYGGATKRGRQAPYSNVCADSRHAWLGRALTRCLFPAESPLSAVALKAFATRGVGLEKNGGRYIAGMLWARTSIKGCRGQGKSLVGTTNCALQGDPYAVVRGHWHTSWMKSMSLRGEHVV